MESLKLPSNYEHKIINVNEKDGGFQAEFRIADVKDRESVNAWIKQFETSSGLVWRCLRTFKCKEKFNIYRKDFKCHHNTDARKRAKNERITKNTDCPAIMKVVVQRYFDVQNLKSPDEEVRNYPCHVQLFNIHNHLLDSAAALRFKPISVDTKEKLQHLFHHGHSAASARQHLATCLELEDAELLADASVLPSLSVIQHLFNVEFKNMYGSKHGPGLDEDLETFCKAYNDQGSGKMLLSRKNDHVVIALTTEIMLRTASLLPQAKELILVDASGHMDAMNHRVYFFVSPGVAGGATIGCIVTDVETEEIFKEGVNLLQQCLPNEYAEDGPKVIMTDGDLKEKNALYSVWPKATFLLCQFHVLKAAWSWLCNAKHMIPTSDRQNLYFKIKDLVYAETNADFIQKVEDLKNCSSFKTSSKFQNYICTLLTKQSSWASCYRQHLPIRGNNTNNYVEVVFKIIKDTILNRVKAYSVIQLLDFIIINYERYLKNRYLDFSHDRYTKTLLKKFLPEKLSSNYNVNFNRENNVFVVSGKQLYFVDAESSFCTCKKGSTGELCSHIAAVANSFATNSIYFYSAASRELMYKIATGKEPRKGFLEPLNYNPIKGNSIMPVSDGLLSAEICRPTSSTSQVEMTVDDDNEDDESDLIALENFYNRIKAEREKNPKIVGPAIKKMVANADKLTTQTALVSAMYNFGKYSGPISSQILKSKRKGVQIPVQPTAPGRRKTSLTGKRRKMSGRPAGVVKVRALKDHIYTSFNMPQKKTSHNLTSCVYKNVSLGKSSMSK